MDAANNENIVQQNNAGVLQAAQANPFQFNIGVAHQALLQNNTPFVNDPYTKPSYFKLRISALLVLICLSLLLASIAVIVLPVTTGRLILYKVTGNSQLNEFYTIIVGLYSLWLLIRCSITLHSWIQIGLFQLFMRFKRKLSLVSCPERSRQITQYPDLWIESFC